MASKEFPVLSLDDIDQIVSPGWLVHEIVPANGLIQVFGREGAGKTFVALDMALRVAAGMPWMGKRPVRPGKAVYVVGEGVTGLKKRISSWRKHYNVEKAQLLNFWVVPEPVQLGEGLHITGIVDSIERVTGSKAADLIVFDTQARCTAGIDENSAEEMGIVVAALDWLRLETGATLMLIHHSPYTEARGRGSSAVAGALDTAIGVSKKEHILTLSCGKQKDWEEFQRFQVGLLPDSDSAVVVEVGSSDPAAVGLAEEILTDEQASLIESLRDRGTSHTAELMRDWKSSKSAYYRTIAKLKGLKLLEDLGGGRIQAVSSAARLSHPANPRSVPPSPTPLRGGTWDRGCPARAANL